LAPGGAARLQQIRERRPTVADPAAAGQELAGVAWSKRFAGPTTIVRGRTSGPRPMTVKNRSVGADQETGWTGPTQFLGALYQPVTFSVLGSLVCYRYVASGGGIKHRALLRRSLRKRLRPAAAAPALNRLAHPPGLRRPHRLAAIASSPRAVTRWPGRWRCRCLERPRHPVAARRRLSRVVQDGPLTVR
jgi:hypothetical protein